MIRTLLVFSPAAVSLAAALAFAPVQAGRAAPPAPLDGAVLYAKNCARCHSLDANKIGPKHRGVVGRRAGLVPGYAYSPALKASGILWTPQALDRWLQGPSAMVPGTKMFFRVADPAQRAAIIGYLAKQK